MKVLLKGKSIKGNNHYFLRIYQCVLLCIIYSLSMPISIDAQEREIKFKHLNIDDGLSQNSITCMIRDDKGFMWLGTQDGLNKYDGYEFKIYKNDHSDTTSISDNYILCLLKDPNGFIWIGTEGGLNKYDPKKEN